MQQTEYDAATESAQFENAGGEREETQLKAKSTSAAHHDPAPTTIGKSGIQEKVFDAKNVYLSRNIGSTPATITNGIAQKIQERQVEDLAGNEDISYCGTTCLLHPHERSANGGEPKIGMF